MELRSVVAALKQRWWLVVLCALLGAGSSLMLWSSSSDLYESRATVLVMPQPGYSGNPDRLVANMLTSAESGEAIEQTAERLGVSNDAVRTGVDAEQTPGSDVVVLTARHATASGAKEMARAYAQTLDIMAHEAARSSLRGQVKSVESRIEQLRPQLPSVEAEYETLVAERNRLLASMNATQLRVVDPATPSVRARGSWPIYLGTGLSIGLLAGIALAVLSFELSPYALDNPRRAAVLGKPVLGRIDIAKRKRGASSSPEGLHETPDSTPVLAALLARIQSSSMDRDVFRIAVVAVDEEADSAGLALLLSRPLRDRSGRVLLVDTDDERLLLSSHVNEGPSVARLDVSPNVVVLHTHVDSVLLLRPRPGRLLERRDIQAILASDFDSGNAEDAARFGMVVIDAGVLLASPHATAICESVDFVVLVLSAKPTVQRLTDVAEVIERTPGDVAVVTVSGRAPEKASLPSPTRVTPRGEQASTQI